MNNNRVSVGRRQNIDTSEWEKILEDALDQIEQSLEKPYIKEYNAAIVLDLGENEAKVSIDIEGTGSERFKDIIDSSVKHAVRGARRKIEEKIGRKSKATGRGAGENT